MPGRRMLAQELLRLLQGQCTSHDHIDNACEVPQRYPLRGMDAPAKVAGSEVPARDRPAF